MSAGPDAGDRDSGAGSRGGGPDGSRPGGPGTPGARPELIPPPGLLVALSVALAAASGFAGRFRETVWVAILLVGTAVVFGMVAGLALRVFWSGGAAEALTGAGGRYLLFLAGVLFAAAQAYAFGVALEQGAPAAAAAFLVPPVAIAALALRSAAGRVRFAPEPQGKDDPEGEPGPGPGG